MMEIAAKTIWCLGVVGWYILRRPHARRARRIAVDKTDDRRREWILMTISASGLGLVPALYVATRLFRFADYPIQPWQPFLGALVFAGALWLFRRTHKELGRNWSVTLELRGEHTLVTDGLYRHVRHPMYSAFWLWALAQAVLLPNWIAGAAGLIGFGTLFFLRIGREEALMIERFGAQYRDYMARTWRVLPGVY